MKNKAVRRFRVVFEAYNKDDPEKCCQQVIGEYMGVDPQFLKQRTIRMCHAQGLFVKTINCEEVECQ